MFFFPECQTKTTNKPVLCVEPFHLAWFPTHQKKTANLLSAHLPWKKTTQIQPGPFLHPSSCSNMNFCNIKRDLGRKQRIRVWFVSTKVVGDASREFQSCSDEFSALSMVIVW